MKLTNSKDETKRVSRVSLPASYYNVADQGVLSRAPDRTPVSSSYYLFMLTIHSSLHGV